MSAKPSYRYYKYISTVAGVLFIAALILQYTLPESTFQNVLVGSSPLLLVIYFYCSNAYMQKLIRHKDAKIKALRWRLESQQASR